MDNNTEGPENRINKLGKSISRRQVLRAGGFAALGLVFLPPRIDTIRPYSVGQVVSPIGPPTAPPSTLPCVAFIDSQASGISGPGITGDAVGSGTTNTYDLNLVYGCGACSDGSCTPSITYQWSAVSTTALGVQIANPNGVSANVTHTMTLGTSGFGLVQFDLQVTVTLVCGSGACQDITQATFSVPVKVFA